MKFFYFLLFSLIFNLDLTAQDESLSRENYLAIASVEDSLEQLANTIVNDSIKANRIAAVEVFKATLATTLNKPYSFQFPFKGLKSVSIQYPADSSFRIFTLQLFINDNEYKYFGAIQKNSRELQLVDLQDASGEIDDPNYDIVDPEEWYGALYYKIEQFKGPGKKTHYLLFGYNGFSFFQKRKVLDVLTFDDKGAPTFGASVFTKHEDDKHPDGRKRLILEYTAEAAVRIQYDPAMNMIIHDHLIPMRARYGETYIPDGSYIGYKLEKGIWRKIDKIWHQVSEEAPRDMPILSGRSGKDLFGN